MGASKSRLILIVLNAVAGCVLFVCLGLSVLCMPFEGLGEGGVDFFSFLDKYGILFIFVLTVLAFFILYFHQKFLLQEQLSRLIALRSEKGGAEQGPESKFQQMFIFAPVGVLETTQDGKIIFANPVSCRIFGFFSPEEFIQAVNKNPKGIISLYANPDVRERMLKELYEGNRSWCRFREEFYRQDGSTFFASTYFSLRYDSELQQECIFGFIEDITEQISMERKLKESERRYRELIEQASAMIIRMDHAGRVTYMNEFAEKFFGFSREEVEGRHVTETIVAPSDLSREDVDAIIREIDAGSDNTFLKENQNLCRDGRRVWVSWSNKAILGEDGNIKEILCVGVDITERKYLEESLQHQLMVERMLQETSFSLANANWEDVEQAVQTSLDRIREFFGSSCSYVCFLDKTGFVKNFYTSCLDGKDQARDFVDRFFLSHSAWWFEKLGESDFILFSDMNDIPSQLESGKLAAQGLMVKRLVAAPIFHQERLVGFIGLNSQSESPVWDERRIKSLRVCGEMFLNVLEQKSYHDDLLESRERLDTTVRGAYLGMYDWDIPSGNMICNDIYFRMLGYSPHEFSHTIETWKSLVHPDDRERVFKSLDGYLHGSSPFFAEEMRLKTKEEGWKWVSVQGHIASRAEDKTPLRLVGLHRDITDLKLAEQELKRQRDILGMLIENMPSGIFAKNVKEDYRFVVWNRQMEKIFGLNRHDVLAKNAHELFKKEFADSYLQDDLEVVRTKRIKAGIKECIETPGGERWVYASKIPIVDDKGEVGMLFGILDDITEKELMEDRLRHTQKMQAIGQLAAGVAHEVKNPLAIILLAAEGLEFKKEVVEDEKLCNKIRIIKKATEKANRVILELLKFSRLSDSDMAFLDLHKIIDDALFLSQNRAKEKHIDFQKYYSNDPVTCYGNTVLLEQVFVNLLNNAVDAIDHTGLISIRTAVEMRTKDQKDIIIEIEDNGKGIPKKILPKIFDPFYTTKDIEHGTGLGLSTVFAIIEKHSGTIRVETEQEKGTKFIMTLPFSAFNSD